MASNGYGTGGGYSSSAGNSSSSSMNGGGYPHQAQQQLPSTGQPNAYPTHAGINGYGVLPPPGAGARGTIDQPYPPSYATAPTAPWNGAPPSTLLATSTSSLPYSAYPEHLASTNVTSTYQAPVQGLSGWNDPPAVAALKAAAHLSAHSSDARGSGNKSISGAKDPTAAVKSSLKRLQDAVIPRMANPKMAQDTIARCKVLEDLLETKEIHDPILALLASICQGCDMKDKGITMKSMDTLLPLCVGSASKWVVGFRRVVDMSFEG